MVEQVDRVTLNGKEYKVEELNEKCQYFVKQLGIVQKELQEAGMLVDRLEVTKQGFSAMLEQAINEE